MTSLFLDITYDLENYCTVYLFTYKTETNKVTFGATFDDTIYDFLRDIAAHKDAKVSFSLNKKSAIGAFKIVGGELHIYYRFHDNNFVSLCAIKEEAYEKVFNDLGTIIGFKGE